MAAQWIDETREVVARFGHRSFSTADFIASFEQLAPDAWRDIVAVYKPGGKGAGKFYTSSTKIAQLLDYLSRYGELEKLDFRPSPSGWGSPVIRYWTQSRKVTGGSFYPDELLGEYTEGHCCQVLVNRYERDRNAREACIRHYGLKCHACEFDFEARYGSRGAGFIHIHHLKRVADADKPYILNPIKDLRPLCPNCHAIVHCREPMLTMQALTKLVREYSN